MGRKRKAILIAALLYERETGQPPLWSELRNMTGIGAGKHWDYKFNQILHRMARDGLVKWTKETRSFVVTEAGREAVLGPQGGDA